MRAAGEIRNPGLRPARLLVTPAQAEQRRGRLARGRNACLPEYLSFWEGVADHGNTRERLGARGAEASGVGLDNLHQSPEEPIRHLECPLQDVLRWSRAGGRDRLFFPSFYSQSGTLNTGLRTEFRDPLCERWYSRSYHHPQDVIKR